MEDRNRQNNLEFNKKNISILADRSRALLWHLRGRSDLPSKACSSISSPMSLYTCVWEVKPGSSGCRDTNTWHCYHWFWVIILMFSVCVRESVLSPLCVTSKSSQRWSSWLHLWAVWDWRCLERIIKETTFTAWREVCGHTPVLFLFSSLSNVEATKCHYWSGDICMWPLPAFTEYMTGSAYKYLSDGHTAANNSPAAAKSINKQPVCVRQFMQQ